MLLAFDGHLCVLDAHKAMEQNWKPLSKCNMYERWKRQETFSLLVKPECDSSVVYFLQTGLVCWLALRNHCSFDLRPLVTTMG